MAFTNEERYVLSYIVTGNITMNFKCDINILGVKLPYLKKPKAFCSGAYGHTIYSLKEAKVQCIADPNCDAIHDEDCLGRYLSLCPSSFLEMTSKASCLHIKQGIFHDWKYVNTH